MSKLDNKHNFIRMIFSNGLETRFINIILLPITNSISDYILHKRNIKMYEMSAWCVVVNPRVVLANTRHVT